MRSLALAALGVLLAAAPAAAGRCLPPEVREPAASITICGDPRAIIVLDNHASTVAVGFRLVWWRGGDDVRRARRIEVRAGQARVVTRRVRGYGRPVSAYDDSTGVALARVFVTRDHGRPDCRVGPA